MIILICIAAGFCKAIVDTIEHHYNESIFVNMSKWWFHDWKRKYNYPKYLRKIIVPFLDGWHCFDLCRTLLFISLVFFKGDYIDYLIGLGTFLLTFNLFYDIILKK